MFQDLQFGRTIQHWLQSLNNYLPHKEKRHVSPTCPYALYNTFMNFPGSWWLWRTFSHQGAMVAASPSAFHAGKPKAFAAFAEWDCGKHKPLPVVPQKAVAEVSKKESYKRMVCRASAMAKRGTWLIDQLSNLLTEWLTNWLTDWLTALLIWLTGWLTACLQKRSFSATPLSKMLMGSWKTKLFGETSFKTDMSNPHLAWVNDFAANAAKILRLPRKSPAEANKVF